MADPDIKSSSVLPDDEDARARAIEERIERLRRLHGWASDTVTVSADQANAIADAGEGKRGKATAKLVLRYSYGGKPEETVEITEDHHDIGSGEAAKLRILDPSVAARHCRISRDGEGFRVRDMNTRTGTWVNDERVPLSSAIADGDTLRCGDVSFAVSIASPTAAAAPATPAAPPAPAKAASKPVPEVARTTVQQSPWVARTPSSTAPASPAAPAARAKPAAAVEPAAAFLIYTDAEGEEREVEIPRDRPLVVGRKTSADVRLTDHGISSTHAAFEWADGEVVVRDLGSTNGTWMHGERVPRAVLADDDDVRLGLVPVRIRIVTGTQAVSERTSMVPAAVAEGLAEGDVEDTVEWEEPAEAPAEDGPPSWHLVFVTDQAVITSMTMDQHQSCVVAGEGPVEISVHGRGLKPEHLQFDWTKTGLEVMQARRDALLKVSGKSVANAALQDGDVVSTGSLAIRVVRSPVITAEVAHSHGAERWAKLLRKSDPQLELLFVDPEAAGGRVELSIWGDCAAQVEQHSGASRDRMGANLSPELLRLLFGAMTQAGFPDVPRASRGGVGVSPELSTFWEEERAQVSLSDALAASWPRWKEVRDLLRAIVDSILE